MKLSIVWAIGMVVLTLMAGSRHKTHVAAARPVPKVIKLAKANPPANSELIAESSAIQREASAVLR